MASSSKAATRQKMLLLPTTAALMMTTTTTTPDGRAPASRAARRRRQAFPSTARQMKPPVRCEGATKPLAQAADAAGAADRTRDHHRGRMTPQTFRRGRRSCHPWCRHSETLQCRRFQVARKRCRTKTTASHCRWTTAAVAQEQAMRKAAVLQQDLPQRTSSRH
jgi:hypothetical protein